MKMKSVFRISTIATPMMIVCGLLVAGSSAWADDGVGGPTCTLKTLKGRYLVAEKGTILPPAFGVTGPTPGANAGFHIFNGDGTGTDIVTFTRERRNRAEECSRSHQLYRQRRLYRHRHSARPWWATL